MRTIARAWLPGWIALGLLLLVYSGTLQRDVNGSSHSYMVDTGEIQVALNTWGTIHHTGYPAFTILGALTTQVMRSVGLPPAAAASAVATTWSLMGLAGFYWLAVRVTEGARWLAALAVLSLGLVETFWIHSVVAEVYSFSLALTSAVLLVGLELTRRWDARYWWLAMLLLGIGAEHHRLLVLLIPPLVLLAAPHLCQQRSSWWAFALKSVLVFALPFLAYLYLPLRDWQGAVWVYGHPGTWDGFWTEFTGRAVAPYFIIWPGDLAAWLDNLRYLSRCLQRQLPIPVLMAGAAGLIVLAWRRAFWTGLGFLTGVLGFVAFVVVLPTAVWAPATLMPSLLLLMLGAAYLLHRLTRSRPIMRWGAWASLVLLSVWLLRASLPFVLGLVSDPHGRDLIHLLQPLNEAELPGDRKVVVLPWGGGYFAAAYGLHVTGELESFEIVDHRANLAAIVNREKKIITPAFNLGRWPLDWWIETLGEAHYSTAAPDVAMVSREVLYKTVPERLGFDLGNGVYVRDARVGWEADGRLRVTLYWEAVRPVQSDYRVAVHLVARVPPQGPQDVLAQSDSVNPVGGWYPTTLWAEGEVVRDDYALVVPQEARPAAVRISMYQINADGSFVTTDWLDLDLPGQSR